MSKLVQQQPGSGRVHAGGGAAETRWLCGPATDTIMALGWIPFFLAALAIQDVEGGLCLLVLLDSYATNSIHAFVFFIIGALHFFYDGFIWKLRQPGVAHSLGVAERAG